MQAYLLRHAIAEDAGGSQPDAQRALVPEGRKKLKEVLRLARAADVAVTLILTSPYRRTRETAEMVADLLAPEAELLECPALTPGNRVEDIWQEMRTHKGADSIMLVGHEPLMSMLAGYLLGAPSLNVDFKKAAMMRIDIEALGATPRGELRWFLTPRLAAGA